MAKQPKNFHVSRRDILAKLFPAGAMCCLAASRALGAGSAPCSQSASAHDDFLSDSQMSFQEVFQFAYRNSFIPTLKNLEKRIGSQELIEMLNEASSARGTQGASKGEDFRTFVEELRNAFTERFWRSVLDIEVVQETDTVLKVRITRCLWAQTFREADASEIGYACICYGDYASATAYNPKLTLVRPTTLMEGHEFCDFTWSWKSSV